MPASRRYSKMIGVPARADLLPGSPRGPRPHPLPPPCAAAPGQTLSPGPAITQE